MSGYKTQLMRGIATELDTAGLAVYAPDRSLSAEERGAYLGIIPETATTGIGIMVYNEAPLELLATETFAQLRIRGSARLTDTLDLADNLRNLFHKRAHFMLGDARVDYCTLESMSPASPNSNGAYELTQNFRFLHQQGARI